MTVPALAIAADVPSSHVITALLSRRSFVHATAGVSIHATEKFIAR